MRDPGELQELAGLPELAVGGLDDADARAVLASVITGRVDEQVVERVIAETRGNPLALLELPRGLSLGELAGGFGVSAAPSPSAKIEERFLTRLRALPAETQELLLVAAAEPVGDPELLWRAAAQVGLGADAAAPAAAAGLLELGSRVRFRHPLVVAKPGALGVQRHDERVGVLQLQQRPLRARTARQQVGKFPV